MEIRPQFKLYLLEQGYTESQILEAWQTIIQLCQQKRPYYLVQTITLEVMTRDLLEGREVETQL